MDAKTAPMDNKTPTMDDKTPTMFGIYDLHPRLLLFAGTRAAILRAGLVELPGKVECEGTTSRIVDGEVAIAVDDGIGLVGIEDVDAAQVGSQ